MPSRGFHFHARQSPNQLAIAAPDGRHWSRGELWEECESLTRRAATTACREGRYPDASPPDAARLIAKALAFGAQARRNNQPSTAAIVDAYQEKIESLGIQPYGDNVHFCVSPDENSDNLSWALASLHHGHALVLAAEWRPELMLRAIERYRVSTVFLDGNQAHDLLILNDRVRSCFDISSVSHLILDLQGHPPCRYRDLQDWFGL